MRNKSDNIVGVRHRYDMMADPLPVKLYEICSTSPRQPYVTALPYSETPTKLPTSHPLSLRGNPCMSWSPTEHSTGVINAD